MNRRRLQPSITRFLEQRISRFEGLDVLLLLHEHADRSWNASEVAVALRLTPSAAAEQLERLCQHDLLDVRLGNEVRYRFGPATSRLAAAVQRVARAYRTHRNDLVAFMRGMHAAGEFRYRPAASHGDGK
jgi:DNA-binding IclR family transcriptional regulator